MYYYLGLWLFEGDTMRWLDFTPSDSTLNLIPKSYFKVIHLALFELFNGTI